MRDSRIVKMAEERIIALERENEILRAKEQVHRDIMDLLRAGRSQVQHHGESIGGGIKLLPELNRLVAALELTENGSKDVPEPATANVFASPKHKSAP